MNKVLAIVGPTGIGKTIVSVKVAKVLNGEIVSADSMLVYRGMYIGTDKPSKERMDEVKHYLIDVVDYGEDFSVARYQELSRKAIQDIQGRSKLPVVVGGSGLYVRTAIDDLEFPAGDLSSAFRENLLMESVGDADRLWQKLKEKDSSAAERIPANNVRRVIRALEVIEATGRPFSERQKAWRIKKSVYDCLIIGLTIPREELYGKIDKRVDNMMADGLLDEVNKIVTGGTPLSTTAAQALGYKELMEYLNGKVSLDLAVESIKMRTRRFAKRQFTWFKADPRIRWLNVSEKKPQEIADDIINLVSLERF